MKLQFRLIIPIFYGVITSTWGNRSDPCLSNPCGIGAECQMRSNLAVCICPGDTSGDPFVACHSPSSSTTASRHHGTTDTSTTMHSSSSMVPYDTSTRMASTDSSSSYSTYRPSTSTTTSDGHTTRFSDFDRYGSGRRPQATSTSTSTKYYTSSSLPSSSTSVTETYNSRPSYNNYDEAHTTSYRNGNLYDSSNDSPITSNREPIRGSAQSSSAVVFPKENNYQNSGRYDGDGYSHRNDYRPSDDSNKFRNDFNNGGSTSSMSYRPEHSSDAPYVNRGQEVNSYNTRRDSNYDNDNYSNRRDSYSNGDQYGSNNRRQENDNYANSNNNNRQNFDNNYYGNFDYSKRPVSQGEYYSGINGNRNTMEQSSSGQNRDRYEGSSGSFDRNSNVRDPLGVYKNCIEINKVVVCADEAASSDGNGNYAPYKPAYETTSRVAVSSSNTHSNNPQEMRINSHVSSHGQDNFSRRQGAPSGNVYQELSVSTHGNKPSQQHHKEDRHPHPPVPQPGDSEQCKKFCGINSVCRSILGRAVCGCPEGYTGDASVQCYPEEEQAKMQNRCQKHTDCEDTQVCEESQCVDPCGNKKAGGANNHGHRMKRMNHYDELESSRRRNDNHQSLTRVSVSQLNGSNGAMSSSSSSSSSGNGVCGSNSDCHVVGHTPLCGCKDGFTGNPYSGCVPSRK